MPSSALGPLSNRPPQYQGQYTLVNKDGRLRFAAVSRRALALPNEVLGQIFVHCLPQPTPGKYGARQLAKLDAPLVLCAVCRRWRDLALTTPGLWGSLFLEQKSVHSVSGADYVDFCRTWLSRAGSTPVSLEFEAYADDERVVSILELIGGLAQQWRDVWLYLGRRKLPRLLRLPEAGKFPFLEKLALTAPFSQLSLSFCDAPNLQGTILGVALNLVDGRFEIAGTSTPFGPLPSMVVPLLHLRVLKLGNSEEDPLPITVLDHLNAPALEDLTLSFRPEQAYSDPSPFLSFVSLSSFPLHTLALSLMPADGEALIECLKATPTVVDLRLRPRLVPLLDIDSLLVHFAGPSNNFLPKLESFLLVLSMSGVFNFTPITAVLVVDMLCWRWRNVGRTRLRSFELHQLPGVGASIKSHPEYRRLQTEGMSLYVGPGNYRHARQDSFMR
ncbi:hypothetical protein C8R45DRAFT_1070655 [Mycena sanguinolenta]|nr:hypothetical protein C8R45DRAFT_1070655 [Mycena sanguinolenta]